MLDSPPNTSNAVLEFFSQTYQASKDENSFSAEYRDFLKAFDTVNHTILCSKLKHISIRGLALEWFIYHATNRTQAARIRSKVSNFASMSIGVPQKTVSGPLLFLVDMNDMNRVHQNF